MLSQLHLVPTADAQVLHYALGTSKVPRSESMDTDPSCLSCTERTDMHALVHLKHLSEYGRQ